MENKEYDVIHEVEKEEIEKMNDTIQGGSASEEIEETEILESNKRSRKTLLIVGTAIVILIFGIIGTLGAAGMKYQQSKEAAKTDNVEKETTEKEIDKEEEGKTLLQYVKGIQNLYVEQNAKEIDWLKAITYDEKKIKAVKENAEKVNLEKTGEYILTYTIVGISGEEETKEITVTVVDSKKAQELANSGKTVLLSKNEVKKAEEEKKDSNKKDAAQEGTKKSDTKTASSSDKSEKKDSGNSNSGTKTNSAQNSSQKGQSTSSTQNNTTQNSTSQQKPSGSNTSSSKPANQTPVHTHNWEKQTKTIHHDATGHNEQYLINDAWTETVTEEVYDPWTCCNVCGADVTGSAGEPGKPGEHMKMHALAGEGGGDHVEYYKTVTNTVYHEAEYGTKWVEDIPAWDETVVTGYKCSGCGATK